MKKPIVAIDGPAGSGKGTMAHRIASHFGFIPLDTGLLFRTMGFIENPLGRNLSVKEVLAVADQLTDAQLRSDENSARASEIAKDPEMRELIANLQREYVDLHRDRGAVLDGRDIGTKIFPDACCKIFLTADLEERARRRFADMKDQEVSFESVFNNMKSRDEQDRSRKIAPLVCDDSYVVVDTTNQTIEEAFEQCKSIVEQSFCKAGFENLIK